MAIGRTDIAILLGVYATFALDVYSTLNSSPQTTELNAEARAETLMKWVKIGDAVALTGGVTATIVTGKPWPLVGAGAVVLLMHGLYVHARNTGLRNGGATTEQY